MYANGEELLPDFQPGTLTDPLELPAGTYDLAVFAAGDDPESAEPAISADGVEVPAGANATVVAHLGEDGDPGADARSSTTPPRWPPARRGSPCGTPPLPPPSTSAPAAARSSRA